VFIQKDQEENKTELKIQQNKHINQKNSRANNMPKTESGKINFLIKMGRYKY
jgi:hypothetical protein